MRVRVKLRLWTEELALWLGVGMSRGTGWGKAGGNGCLMRDWIRRWEVVRGDGNIRNIFVDFDCILGGKRGFGMPSTLDLSRVLIELIEI